MLHEPDTFPTVIFETLVESFYSVNNVNVNYHVKYLTVDCKYLLYQKIFYLD